MNTKRIGHALVCLLIASLLSIPPTPARAATFTVTSTADSGAGTLRWAINSANASPGADTIEFNIDPHADPNCVGATGVCTIYPLTQLPYLTDAGTTIDGYTQGDAHPATATDPAEIRIQLNGSANAACTLANSCNGLNIASANHTVRGLSIVEWEWNAIVVGGTGATGNVISGNYLGLTADGAAAGNDFTGITIALEAANNTIGGDEPAERNLIGSNGYEGVGIHGAGATGNVISGNYIGVDETGTGWRSNSWDGVRIYGGASNNLVGGDSTGERNLISGNDRDGVRLLGGSGNIVSGNTIGLDLTGSAALNNASSGVYISNAGTEHVIGGDTPGERNIISGNLQSGVMIDGAGTNDNRVIGNYIGTDVLGISDRGICIMG